jgi:hypothetical protein
MESIRTRVQQAQQAFWKVIANDFPHITTGDFPPLAQEIFDEACERAVEIWVRVNGGHHITYDAAADEMNCTCGNTSHTDGFVSVDEAAHQPVEPVQGEWEGRYMCQSCGTTMLLEGTR